MVPYYCTRTRGHTGAHEDGGDHSWSLREKRRLHYMSNAEMIDAINDIGDPAAQVDALKSMVRTFILAVARLHLSGTSERNVESAFEHLLDTAAAAAEIMEKVDA